MFYSFMVCCLILLSMLCFVPAKGQYDDVRCRCVCPAVTKPNSTVTSARIIVRFFSEPSSCKCENVVEEWILLTSVHFCDSCDCQWQRRNTMTIKVVVFLIICVVSLLFIYMLFLSCLGPILTYRSKVNYAEQRNEEIVMYDVREGKTKPASDAIVLESISSNVGGGGGVVSRVKRQVQRVSGEAERWQRRTVVEQRKNIYDRHTILN